MEEYFLPVLSHFVNGNAWTASAGRMRYQAVPSEDGSTLTAQVWEGPFGHAFSQVEEEVSFPLSQEGLEALRAWLLRWRETMNARPKKTLAETIAARDARRAGEVRVNSGRETAGCVPPGGTQ